MAQNGDWNSQDKNLSENKRKALLEDFNVQYPHLKKITQPCLECPRTIELLRIKREPGEKESSWGGCSWLSNNELEGILNKQAKIRGKNASEFEKDIPF